MRLTQRAGQLVDLLQQRPLPRVVGQPAALGQPSINLPAGSALQIEAAEAADAAGASLIEAGIDDVAITAG